MSLPRIILTRGTNCWLAEFPDDDALNMALTELAGVVLPVPLPYAISCPYSYVSEAIRHRLGYHTIQRGIDINPTCPPMTPTDHGDELDSSVGFPPTTPAHLLDCKYVNVDNNGDRIDDDSAACGHFKGCECWKTS